MIKVEIVADSLNEVTNNRLTTFLLTYPRFIHSELMTHRVFSRNAASSRAIPAQKMIEAVKQDPAMPVEWGTTKAGMQAGPPLEGVDKENAEYIWVAARDKVIPFVQDLLALDVHKQVANRLLEPWMHMTTVVTATEWGNFFRLRAHEAADPTFQELAYDMLAHYYMSRPEVKEIGEWHLPFVDPEELQMYGVKVARQISVARCARTSYVKMLDRTKDVTEDSAMHGRLKDNGHHSPFEHQARAVDTFTVGNFSGWEQYRAMIEKDEQHKPLTKEEMEQIISRRQERMVRTDLT